MLKIKRQIFAASLFPPNIREYMGIVRIEVGGVALGNAPATVVVNGSIDDVQFYGIATPDKPLDIDGYNFASDTPRKVRINSFVAIDNAGAPTTCTVSAEFIMKA